MTSDPNVSERKETKNFLSIVSFVNGIEFFGDSICTIDLCGFQINDKCVIIPGCKHIFHAKCLEEWLKSDNNERKCPNCNSSLIGYIFMR